MRSRDPLLWLSAGVAAFASAVTWGVWVTTDATGALALAVLVQLGAGVAMMLLSHRERRTLAVTLAVTVPVVGPLATAIIEGVRGQGGAELLADPEPPRQRLDGVEIARRLTASLPPCEAIVSSNVDARRATIARLTQRAAADDIAILRWARNQDNADVAVEAALAFEEINQRFEQRVQAARAAAQAHPSFATHATALLAISDGIVTGIVDTALTGKLAEEARKHHEAALALEPSRALEIAAPRARIELATRRPAAALDVLTPAISKSADPELLELHIEAAYAARRFDLTPGLAARRTGRAAA